MRDHLVRLVRLMLPARNPMRRGADRVEGYSLLFVVLAGTAMVPIMLMVGSLSYANAMQTGEQRLRTRYEVVATLLEDAPRTVVGASAEGTDGSSRVLARWYPASGAPRTGRIPVEHHLAAGAEVTTWLDESGDPVNPPATKAGAAVAGVLVAVTGWLTAAGFLGIGHAGLKYLLDRRRYRAWGREWARVEPDWRTGRQ
jgi:hypothetical protein